MCSPDMYRENLNAIRGHAETAGRRDVQFETAAFLFTILDDNYKAALDRAANLLQMIYNRPFRDAARKYCLLGPTSACLDQLQAFVDAGCRHFVLSPLMDAGELVARCQDGLLAEVKALRPRSSAT